MFTLLVCLSLFFSSGKSAFAAEFTFHICNRIPGLGPTLKEMCIKRTDKFLASAFGFTAGIQQCRNLFNNERWNCTTKGDIHQHGLNGIVMARGKKLSKLKFFSIFISWRKIDTISLQCYVISVYHGEKPILYHYSVM